MNIQVVQDGNKVSITLEGKLDTYTSPELKKTLDELPKGITDLEFDCEKLIYVSSAGLRVLIGSLQIVEGGKAPVLHNLNDFVKETMDMTGVTDFFTIE